MGRKWSRNWIISRSHLSVSIRLRSCWPNARQRPGIHSAASLVAGSLREAYLERANKEKNSIKIYYENNVKVNIKRYWPFFNINWILFIRDVLENRKLQAGHVFISFIPTDHPRIQLIEANIQIAVCLPHIPTVGHYGHHQHFAILDTLARNILVHVPLNICNIFLENLLGKRIVRNLFLFLSFS